MRSSVHPQKTNFWKIAFWTLITLIIALVVALFIMIKVSSNDTAVQETRATNGVPITTTVNKKQINQLSDYYLAKLQKQNSNTRYHFVVKKQCVLYGTMKAFGSNVPYGLSFIPKVLSNGDVQLQATKLSVGDFAVPVSLVMAFVKQNYAIPKWAVLNPEKHLVTLNITDLNGPDGVNFKAKKIDMNGKGRFVFDIIVPGQ